MTTEVRTYLLAAYDCAARRSTDKSTWNGAIIIPKNFLGYGTEGSFWIAEANRFPDGVLDLPQRHQRPMKYAYVEHAERNAIYYAAKNGFALKGATMYACWFACADCARAIIQAGIARVVGHRTPVHQTRLDWQQSIADGVQMLQEAGIVMEYLEEELGVQTLFNGKMEQV